MLLGAESLPTSHAVFADAARAVKPWDANAITDLEVLDVGANSNDATTSFMARAQRKLG